MTVLVTHDPLRKSSPMDSLARRGSPCACGCRLASGHLKWISPTAWLPTARPRRVTPAPETHHRRRDALSRDQGRFTLIIPPTRWSSDKPETVRTRHFLGIRSMTVLGLVNGSPPRASVLCFGNSAAHPRVRCSYGCGLSSSGAVLRAPASRAGEPVVILEATPLHHSDPNNCDAPSTRVRTSPQLARRLLPGGDVICVSPVPSALITKS
jgi:hypothetical protein